MPSLGSCPWPREMVCQGTFLDTANARSCPVGSMPGVSTNLGQLVWADWIWHVPVIQKWHAACCMNSIQFSYQQYLHHNGVTANPNGACHTPYSHPQTEPQQWSEARSLILGSWCWYRRRPPKSRYDRNV